MSRVSAFKDFLTRVSFELAAGWYARKLREGPETDLREEFLAFMKLGVNERVLDVGCGPGHVARRMAETVQEVMGVDRSRAMIRLARRAARRLGRSNVQFECAETEHLPFPSQSFDLVVATTLLYLLRDPLAALREMARVARPGGRIATMDPHVSMSPERMERFVAARALPHRGAQKLRQWARAATFFHRFESHELAGLYQSAGLVQIEMEKWWDGMVLFARAKVRGLWNAADTRG